ncbi:hypothetical protein IscW_ISCW017716 [Ixodes scapularis]|uniref:Uncharacterized protein n=1 Tax=Ixodes scapularis TaxID=6945 RepID=B7PG39_IXOSC|nr:hypothetical protein IscW_ISCW017716 [Ixodes scapularis]|eukprot:XP_002434161.1 hypothetical protein IscW_ISCW017716 [Ixodes scapularis]
MRSGGNCPLSRGKHVVGAAPPSPERRPAGLLPSPEPRKRGLPAPVGPRSGPEAGPGSPFARCVPLGGHLAPSEDGTLRPAGAGTLPAAPIRS